MRELPREKSLAQSGERVWHRRHAAWIRFGFNRERSKIRLLDFQKELFTTYVDITRRVDPNPHLFALDLFDDDDDVISNSDRLPNFSS